MSLSRIKNPALAAQITGGELAWLRYVMPITEHYCQQIAARDYRGKRLACWMHITFNTVPMLLALQESGAEIILGACNTDSTDDASAAFLAERGITVYGSSGMSQAEYDQSLRDVRAFGASYLCDMGGELIAAYLDKDPPAVGALEATTSGLHQLRGRQLPFPAFDWNSIPLKAQIENRFHVGDGVWPAFSHVTGMGLFGRRVLIVGYGPVGKGIAERARNLGALVYVADLDPVRLIEARHHGCATIGLDEGLAQCQIIVTATGVERVLGAAQLALVRPGAILFNAGHSNQEIDIGWLYAQPRQLMRPHLERFDIGGTHLFLLGHGSLLNLAASSGPHGNDLFDHYTAIMLQGIGWMFDGIPARFAPGLQLYPAELEREIAQISVALHQG